jgi:hypothetical protein
MEAQMDGLFHGKSFLKMDDLGVLPFQETFIYIYSLD